MQQGVNFGDRLSLHVNISVLIYFARNFGAGVAEQVLHVAQGRADILVECSGHVAVGVGRDARDAGFLNEQEKGTVLL